MKMWGGGSPASSENSDMIYIALAIQGLDYDKWVGLVQRRGLSLCPVKAGWAIPSSGVQMG